MCVVVVVAAVDCLPVSLCLLLLVSCIGCDYDISWSNMYALSFSKPAKLCTYLRIPRRIIILNLPKTFGVIDDMKCHQSYRPLNNRSKSITIDGDLAAHF